MSIALVSQRNVISSIGTTQLTAFNDNFAISELHISITNAVVPTAGLFSIVADLEADSILQNQPFCQFSYVNTTSTASVNFSVNYVFGRSFPSMLLLPHGSNIILNVTALTNVSATNISVDIVGLTFS